jgi:hypothetical protein
MSMHAILHIITQTNGHDDSIMTYVSTVTGSGRINTSGIPLSVHKGPCSLHTTERIQFGAHLQGIYGLPWHLSLDHR